jgi:hypothetical protein
MWFCPVNEITEPVSGMPAPQFGDESSLVRGSELVRGSSGSFFVLIDVSCFPNRLTRIFLAFDIGSSI